MGALEARPLATAPCALARSQSRWALMRAEALARVAAKTPLAAVPCVSDPSRWALMRAGATDDRGGKGFVHEVRAENSDQNGKLHQKYQQNQKDSDYGPEDDDRFHVFILLFFLSNLK